MNGRGMMGYAGGRRTMVPYGRPFPPRFVIGLVIGGVVLALRGRSRLPLLPTSSPTDLGRTLLGSAGVRGRHAGLDGAYGVPCAEGWDGDGGRARSRSLEALARHGRSRPALAALETSLSVAEANRMLSDLANSGHVEVRAREGRLGYALWERDRRELTDGS